MPKPRILFVLKYRTIDIKDTKSVSEQYWNDTEKKEFLHSGLYNSANFMCEMMIKNGYEAKLVHVLDSNFIHREAVNFKADIVIVEAFWVTPEKFHELHSVMPKTKFIIRNHSEVPFLANEGIALDWTIRYFEVPNLYVSCNAPRMLNQTQFLYQHLYGKTKLIDTLVPYLPNYYPLPEKHVVKPTLNSNELKVGCFGAIRPLKNTLMQALASIEVAEKLNKELRFHINGGRVEMGGAPILKNLRQMFSHLENKGHKLVELGWLNHKEFLHVVFEMDVVMQVSFSETFNIVLADAVGQGTTIIGSQEIPWLCDDYCADPASQHSIVNKTLQAIKMWQLHPNFAGNFYALKEYSENSEKIWLNYFKGD